MYYIFTYYATSLYPRSVSYKYKTNDRNVLIIQTSSLYIAKYIAGTLKRVNASHVILGADL